MLNINYNNLKQYFLVATEKADVSQLEFVSITDVEQVTARQSFLYRLGDSNIMSEQVYTWKQSGTLCSNETLKNILFCYKRSGPTNNLIFDVKDDMYHIDKIPIENFDNLAIATLMVLDFCNIMMKKNQDNDLYNDLQINLRNKFLEFSFQNVLQIKQMVDKYQKDLFDRIFKVYYNYVNQIKKSQGKKQENKIAQFYKKYDEYQNRNDK